MEPADSVADEIKLLSQPSHMLSDKSLVQLYEFASKSSWHNRLCNSNSFNKDVRDAYQITVGITPESADALLLVLTRSVARFQSHTELQKRASRRQISIETLVSLSESSGEQLSFGNGFNDEDLGNGSEDSRNHTFISALDSDNHSHLNDEIDVLPIPANQSCTLDSHETPNTNKSQIGSLLHKDCLQKMTARKIENYGTANDQKVIYDLISSIFPDSKRRSKLTLVRDCVLSILEWSQKLNSRRSEIDALLGLLDKKLRKRGCRGGARVGKQKQIQKQPLSKSRRSKLRKQKFKTKNKSRTT